MIVDTEMMSGLPDLPDYAIQAGGLFDGFTRRVFWRECFLSKIDMMARPGAIRSAVWARD